MKNYFHHNIIVPITRLLKQGISPEKIALALALGIILGIFPVIGATTVLCLLAAFLFRLNIVGIQMVNYLVYPLQILLLIPFYHLGGWLFGGEQALPLSAQQLVLLFKTDFWAAVQLLGGKTMQAIVVWALIFPPVLLSLYFSFKPLIRKLKFSSTASTVLISNSE